MDILKAEIEARKRKLEDARAGGRKKWVRRKDLAAASEDSKDNDGASKSLAGALGGSNKDGRPTTSFGDGALRDNSSSGKGKSHSLNEREDDEDFDDFDDDDDVKVTGLSQAEVWKRLRGLGEPVTLFGETLADSERRLRRLEAKGLSVREGLEGQRNAFLMFSSSTEVEDLEDERKKKKKGDDEDDDEDGAEKKQRRYGWSDDWKSRSVVERITRFLKHILEEWEFEIDSFSRELRQSPHGKREILTFRTTKEFLRPMFKKLKNGALEPEIVEALRRMVDFMIAKEYVQANDAYLSVAIGNSPWPMGVTMVGIHERSARERIFSSSTAHILNDETTRKYLTSVKRLITYCQKVYPTVPSKMVS